MSDSNASSLHQNWSKALKITEAAMPMHERAYPPYHPLLGLQWFLLARLQWLLRKTSDACSSFSKAAAVYVCLCGLRL